MIQTFEKTETKEFAIFISNLIKECVVFEIINDQHQYIVKLTGGF
jgi:hypothetical protein